MAKPRSLNEGPTGVRYTVPPKRSTPVVMRTKPNGTCLLHREGDEDPAHALRLYADPEGFIRFHATPSAESSDVARLVVDCEVDGEVTTYGLHLRPRWKASRDAPLPKADAASHAQRKATFRRGLSDEELSRLSDGELLERGYPVRPDPDGAPRAYANWRRIVSVGSNQIEPNLISRPDITHDRLQVVNGPKNSSNWSGFELSGAAGTYDWVTGKWFVPAVEGETNTYTFSSLWIGLDGDGTKDLFQAGTEQENLTIDFWIFHIAFSSYYAWTEFLPQQGTEQQISNFPVSPGDEIFVEVWIGNAGSSPNLAGAFGVAFVANMTTGESTYVYTQRGGTVVGGSEAEWIMERPTVGGSLPDLANYHAVTMFDAYARRTNSPRHGGYVSYQGAANTQIAMTNGPDTLSTVSPIDAWSMRFSWQRFN